MHMCHACERQFPSAVPSIGHPFSTLCPTLTNQTLTFGSHSLPTIAAAFDGMDHLAEESDITTLTAASAYLHSLGVVETAGVDVLRGAQKLKIMLTLNPDTVN